MQKVNILGTEYKIYTDSDNSLLDSLNAAGLCEQYSKNIYLKAVEQDSMENVEKYKQRLLRHELIHAFLIESGLGDECDFADNEMLIDWIALQFPKMIKVFEETNAI